MSKDDFLKRNSYSLSFPLLDFKKIMPSDLQKVPSWSVNSRQFSEASLDDDLGVVPDFNKETPKTLSSTIANDRERKSHVNENVISFRASDVADSAKLHPDSNANSLHVLDAVEQNELQRTEDVLDLDCLNRIDCIREKILQQEETFNKQVWELHKAVRVQISMSRDIENETSEAKPEVRNSETNSKSNSKPKPAPVEREGMDSALLPHPENGQSREPVLQNFMFDTAPVNGKSGTFSSLPQKSGREVRGLGDSVNTGLSLNGKESTKDVSRTSLEKEDENKGHDNIKKEEKDDGYDESYNILSPYHQKLEENQGMEQDDKCSLSISSDAYKNHSISKSLNDELELKNKKFKQQIQLSVPSFLPSPPSSMDGPNPPLPSPFFPLISKNRNIRHSVQDNENSNSNEFHHLSPRCDRKNTSVSKSAMDPRVLSEQLTRNVHVVYSSESKPPIPVQSAEASTSAAAHPHWQSNSSFYPPGINIPQFSPMKNGFFSLNPMNHPRNFPPLNQNQMQVNGLNQWQWTQLGSNKNNNIHSSNNNGNNDNYSNNNANNPNNAVINDVDFQNNVMNFSPDSKSGKRNMRGNFPEASQNFTPPYPPFPPPMYAGFSFHGYGCYGVPIYSNPFFSSDSSHPPFPPYLHPPLPSPRNPTPTASNSKSECENSLGTKDKNGSMASWTSQTYSPMKIDEDRSKSSSFKRPPPLVLVKQKGKSEMRLIPAEEYERSNREKCRREKRPVLSDDSTSSVSNDAKVRKRKPSNSNSTSAAAASENAELRAKVKLENSPTAFKGTAETKANTGGGSQNLATNGLKNHHRRHFSVPSTSRYSLQRHGGKDAELHTNVGENVVGREFTEMLLSDSEPYEVARGAGNREDVGNKKLRSDDLNEIRSDRNLGSDSSTIPSRSLFHDDVANLGNSIEDDADESGEERNAGCRREDEDGDEEEQDEMDENSKEDDCEEEEKEEVINPSS